MSWPPSSSYVCVVAVPGDKPAPQPFQPATSVKKMTTPILISICSSSKYVLPALQDYLELVSLSTVLCICSGRRHWRQTAYMRWRNYCFEFQVYLDICCFRLTHQLLQTTTMEIESSTRKQKWMSVLLRWSLRLLEARKALIGEAESCANLLRILMTRLLPRI